MAMNNYLSIITLNLKGLNAPIKTHKIADWIRKHNPHISYWQETLSGQKTYTDWNWRAGNKFSKQTDREKKAGVAILILDKIKFKKGDIKRHPEVHFKTLKGIIHQEDINIVNIYAPNIGVPKYIKKILEDFKRDIDSNTIIVGDFNTPLSKMDRSSKQNINKDIVSLNNTLDEMDLSDI